MNVERFKGSEWLVKEVRSRLINIITMYDYVTVADYYDIIGYETKYTDIKVGWISLREATIAMTDEPGIYELILPKPIPITFD